ncbi:helix-turn-helix transcriptional regulator [Candidatus Bathyarchaeota archaeon]|nr:helix-turn-helix transcriptional regulator [Candidatus Bathyarchaeota archaeon]
MPHLSSSEDKIFELHAAMCQTLANPVRLKILYLLRHGEKSVNELAQMLRIPQANVSQHLAVLRDRSIVLTRREGTSIHYRISNPKITKACEMIREMLFEHLASEERLVKSILQRR